MTEYPIEFEEFEKVVIELYLNEYPDEKNELILDRLERMLNHDEDLMKRLYKITCIRYNRSNLSEDDSEKIRYKHFVSLAVYSLRWHIGGNFDNTDDMSALKKVEKNFQILVKDFFLNEDCIGDYDYHLPILTEESFDQREFHRVPGMYGGFFYILKLENGKPILYANASSRMDLDEDFVIDEICYTWTNTVTIYGN